jgi:threonylcarbamoyladenosine tRNA methylthiotransferase MtaB
MKYAVITFGCRVNQADSIGFEDELIASGGEPAPVERADLVIVNTCSVTATADQGARQTIRRIARDNPAARIVVTGCYATRAADDVAALPNVTRVVPNDGKPQLVHWLTSRETDRSTSDRFGDGDGACGERIEPGVAGRTAFTLRVQTGCDEPCAYCIIPSTRGAPRSASPTELIGEIHRVIAAGFKEIALTGVHLGSYGHDLRPKTSLLQLLEAVAASIPGDRSGSGPADVVFRISSLEPMDCSRAIIDLVESRGCFAPHFHLPLQHASDRVLAAMRRPYTIDYYASLVDHIRGRLPHASIGTDIIVGFPGEEDEDFEQLASYLEASPLTHVHVFPYSDRPGTAASRMPNKVHGAVVRERARRVRAIGARLTETFRAGQIGTVHRALTLEDGSLAVTGNYLKLRIPPGRMRNEWVAVRVTGPDTGTLVASP